MSLNTCQILTTIRSIFLEKGIPVDEMEVIRRAVNWSENDLLKEDSVMNFPKNYLTCFHLITGLRKLGDVCGM